MKHKYSLSLHDLRISGNEKTLEKIKKISEIFPVPLTLHLVFDQPLAADSMLFNYLKNDIKEGKIEIVFHGLSHLCSKKVYRLLAFYHKYEAEYLVDSTSLREDSAIMYRELSELLGHNPGICPPCWIAHKKNLLVFKLLKPLYIETLTGISVEEKNYFSSVLSLASLLPSELFFLKILARSICYLSLLLKIKRIRIAIHNCDLSNPESIAFFQTLVSSVEKHGFHAVLLKDLV